MKDNPLAKQFTSPEILKFAFPNMVMMVFLSLYTIIDGMFISRFAGELALSATNMFYPVTSFQLAVGIMLGSGGSAIIALKMGQGEKKEAGEDFTLISVVALVTGGLFTALCIPFLQNILKLLGTSPIQMEDCMIYAEILLCFSPMMFLQVVFQTFFVTAGKPHMGLGFTVAGGIANMVLDYVFMALMDMGVAGAALATGIGYCFPALAGVIYFGFNKRGTLHFVKFPVRPGVLLRTCMNGSSEMVTNVAVSVTTFLFNIIFMKYWAENGVATITILSYFQFTFSSVYMGFSMGVSPVISYKYGAGDHRQLKKIFRFSIEFLAICSVAVFFISRVSAGFSISVFTDVGSPVYNLALKGFGIYSLQFLIMGFSIFASAFFTALNNGIVSASISVCRTFIFLVGSLLILPSVWGENGVWYAVPLAELLGLFVSAGFILKGRKKYGY